MLFVVGKIFLNEICTLYSIEIWNSDEMFRARKCQTMLKLNINFLNNSDQMQLEWGEYRQSLLAPRVGPGRGQ